ncbi:CGNR zinc finger domain-containing protein [Catenuloplanes sp. NPDC051500]|uniref:CGNR zinc finger domain-containing protein n=1 Tax=Catenuloplanes sp. NPDC051500 TaxID=3363959 RepID=UPI0037A525B7
MPQPGKRDPAPGPLALVQDLANTHDIEGGHDSLTDTAALDAFCTAHGLTAPPARDADLALCRDLREAVRDACLAHTGTEMPPALLRRLLRRGPLLLDVDATGEAHLIPAPARDAAGTLIATVAAAIATAAANGTWPRLKACASDICRWVYYDHSPAGRGRWCTMSICGSRAKMRTYRTRPGS